MMQQLQRKLFCGILAVKVNIDILSVWVKAVCSFEGWPNKKKVYCSPSELLSLQLQVSCLLSGLCDISV